jgi:aryl-alcohol dehydrogenase-like predicted oxidoreductase
MHGMEYRQLGNSGILVSNLALGTMNFGTRETTEAEAFAQLDAFLDAGGNLIDTADVYNGGIAEETVGRWFAARPREVTDRAVIATKGRTRTVASAIIGARNTPQLADNLAVVGLRLDPDAMAALDAASDPDPDPYPYGPFGSAQRNRTANGPEALGQLIRAHASTAKETPDGLHAAR